MKPTILCAIDLELGTDLALRTAIETASRTQSRLVVLHVFEPGVSFEFDSLAGIDPEKKIGIVRKRLLDAFQAFVDAYPKAELPPAEIHVTVGRAIADIVWMAAYVDADSIVIGSHGRRGIGRLLLGSVAEKVVRLAGCPVIVARDKHHDPKAKLPEILPLCEDCAKARAESGGTKLWCARHLEHHPRAHTYSSAGRVEETHAWSSSTGS